jgi:hypothetical protein
LIRCGKDVDNLAPPCIVGVFDALLDDIARELVLAVTFEADDDKFEDPVFILGAAFLDDVLDDIVAVLICNHALLHANMELSQDVWFCWEEFWSLKTTLYDPATIRVQTEVLNLTKEGVVDEADSLWSTSFDCLLNDVVAILIFDTLQNVIFQFTNKRGLLFDEDMLKRFLHDPTAVHL